MTRDTSRKVRTEHLERNAYLYVRQSSLHQVLVNTESTKRQYDLQGRATALGWPRDQVVIIDSDLGQSGARAADREGFQFLMTEVSMARAGIVMGLEVSRLARNSSDWHRLLEICAMTDTLILDEDGIYDPALYNDRLLLGLKGAMSEAELHMLRARLQGGILSRARRGVLRTQLPMGLVYDEAGRVQLHPDQRVRASIHLLFETFRRTGSALGVVKAFAAENLRFPHRPQRGPRDGTPVWGELQHSRVVSILRNPRYAGAFCYGRSRQRKHPDGRTLLTRLPRKDWIALIRDAHPGYVSWQTFEENGERLAENARAHGCDRRRSPAREGPALLQGLVLCGRCGNRMTVHYHVRQGQRIPDYMCSKALTTSGKSLCQQIHGEALDDALGKLVLETVYPLTLEVALAVQSELEERACEVDRLRRDAVEAARHEAEQARRRYRSVDPDNRLVAASLEAEWNDRLRALDEAQAVYERERMNHQAGLDEEQKERILALATDFPRLWADPHTPDRERKRMLRLLVEDVTLVKSDRVTAHVRFKGGATHTLEVPLPLRSWMKNRTPPSVVERIDHLLEDHTNAEIANMLNAEGVVSGTGRRFRAYTVEQIRVSYGLRSRYERLRKRGMLDRVEIAERLGIHPDTVHQWRRKGILVGHRYNDKGSCLYPPPGANQPVKGKHGKGPGSRKKE